MAKEAFSFSANRMAAVQPISEPSRWSDPGTPLFFDICDPSTIREAFPLLRLANFNAYDVFGSVYSVSIAATD